MFLQRGYDEFTMFLDGVGEGVEGVFENFEVPLFSLVHMQTLKSSSDCGSQFYYWYIFIKYNSQ